MRGSSDIDSILDVIAQGEQREVNTLLSILPEAELFLPVSSARYSEDANPHESFSIPTFRGGGRKLIPVFSSERFFLEWAHDRYDPVPVAGSVLCETLQPDTWIVLNPGQPNTLQLSPKQISLIAALAEERVNSEQQEIFEAPGGETIERDSSLEQAYEHRVASRLKLMLSRYPEVSEAYFSLTKRGFAEAVLGLLTMQIRPDRRFNMMADIAELSREFFGAAGAIEVYDDLHLQNSKSWELFSSLAPFYERKVEDGEDLRNYSSLQVEVEKITADPTSGKESFFGRRRSLLSRFFRYTN